ncbi:prophage protein [Liquorilactobacillus mali KCTC 3596 = DSM 20444]|uniref:Prophage protein n=2 Tax=Liquorilactobacillus mali TaxID=1618 RepID=A0A0R2EET8_9LACO|nr:prophage protein [Liquorilactobacillus mali KCTC 3596 = DSM 20444]
MPSHSYGNGTEKSMVNHVDLAYQIKQVEDALKAVEDPRYSFILNEYIINKRYSVEDCCHMWGVSRSKFNYMKNKALEKFVGGYTGEKSTGYKG